MIVYFVVVECKVSNTFSFHTDKATNPLNKEADWDCINGFCDQLNDEPEGWEMLKILMMKKHLRLAIVFVNIKEMCNWSVLAFNV